jgi:hypothetical protein
VNCGHCGGRLQDDVRPRSLGRYWCPRCSPYDFDDLTPEFFEHDLSVAIERVVRDYFPAHWTPDDDGHCAIADAAHAVAAHFITELLSGTTEEGWSDLARRAGDR